MAARFRREFVDVYVKTHVNNAKLRVAKVPENTITSTLTYYRRREALDEGFFPNAVGVPLTCSPRWSCRAGLVLPPDFSVCVTSVCFFTTASVRER